MAASSRRSVLVVGAGLIGTSIALALQRRDHRVWLADVNAVRVEQAVELKAGTRYSGERVDVSVVAVPPATTARVVAERLSADTSATVTDTASIKGELEQEVERLLSNASGTEALPAAMNRYVGGHPLAGRERSGPHRARADLFAGRAWVLTPRPNALPAAVEDARWLASECGAIPLTMSADAHDRALAVTSHLPQMVASALAAQLADQPDDVLQLVGQALRDMTRIAAADPQLWADIAGGNAIAIADAIDRLTAMLHAVSVALRSGPSGAGAASDLIQSGQNGYRRLPGKHGGAARSYRIVPVIVRDQPGEIARLLADTAAAGVNLEDIRVEHAPGLPVGLIELFVGPESATPLRTALTERGWTVTDDEAPS